MKLYTKYEIEDALENSGKYGLSALVAMQSQMLKHENFLYEQYRFYAEELEGVSYAPLQAALYSDFIQQHGKNMRIMDSNIKAAQAA